MPIFRTLFGKVKPGRMQDAVTQIETYKRLSMESGAMAFAALNIVTGPLFPGVITHVISEDLAAFGATRDKILAHPESAQFFAADAPITIVNAGLAETVHRAGPSIAERYDQMNVRISIAHKPHVGREGDVVRRLSRFADAAHESGTMTAAVRRIIAGTDGPRLALFGYFTDFTHLDRARAALREHEVWTALSHSQDEASTHMGTTICTKLEV